jgi:hypothetical protein
MIPSARLLERPWCQFLHRFRAAVSPIKLELVVKVLLPDGNARLEAGVEDLLAQRLALGVDRLVLWGQLRDRSSVYLNARTLPFVDAGWRQLLERIDAGGWPLEGALLDLEPDLRRLSGLSRLEGSAWRWLLRGQSDLPESSVHELQSLVSILAARGPVIAAVPPLSILGPLAPLAARRLGLLVDGVAWPEITEMTYTSFLLPVLGPVLGNDRAWRLAGAAAGALARASTRRPGRRSVICGTCGIGLLGNEPCFPHARSMRAQVRAAASARPHAIGVFNLLGLVSDGRGYRPGLMPDEARWEPWARMLREELMG